MAFGIVQIHSAKPKEPSLWHKQIVAMVLGLIVMFILTKMDYNRLFSLAPYLYGFGIFLLVLVLLFGERINGNKNWLKLGRCPGGGFFGEDILSRPNRLTGPTANQLSPHPSTAVSKTAHRRAAHQVHYRRQAENAPE